MHEAVCTSKTYLSNFLRIKLHKEVTFPKLMHDTIDALLRTDDKDTSHVFGMPNDFSIYVYIMLL